MTTNDVISLTNEQDSIPRAATGTGTISSVNNGRKIVGVGSDFETEANVGDWVYIKPQNAFRKIINILNDLELTIENPFDTPLVASTYFITPASRLKEIAILIETLAADIGGVSVPQGVTLNYEKSWIERNSAGNFVEPVDITVPNGGVVIVSTQY